MTCFTLLSRVRRPDDGPLASRCLPAPLLVTLPPGRRPPTAVWQSVAQPQIHLQLVFYVYARALTHSEEVTAAEAVQAMVFEAVFFNASPRTVFALLLPEITFKISGTNVDNKFVPNFLATGITYRFMRGIATRPIRMTNAPKPPDPYWRVGPRKTTALGVRPVFCRIWLAKWASINLSRSIYLRVSFPNDHNIRDAVLWLTLVTDCERTIVSAVS